MRNVHVRGLFLLALVVLAAGCSSNKGKIEGTKWTSLAGNVKGQAIPAGLEGLEFRSDGGLVYQVAFQTYTGRYSLGALNTVILQLDQPIAGAKTHAEKVVIEGDQLTMTDADGTQLTFAKVTATEPQQK